ncbi:autotransporter-associated beta strand repeat-containing protein [Poriferisphaera sp. WC338]|uniref:autotransporter-associated beta strand repeat-containing protein n=1 Tax=Poriferisphaera sp. WC338 TaxID=3425129 RepID=UPI003D8136D5
MIRHPAILLSVCALSSTVLHAADVTFTGGTSNVWTVDSNWAGGTAPAANVDGVITIESGNGASPFTLTGIDLSYINMNGLTLSSSGTDGDYTLTGTGSFTFNDGTIIENAKTGSMTIDVDVIGTGTELALEAVTGNIFVSGNVDLSDSGGVILAIDGLSGVDVSGVISGTGGNVELLGPNTVTLSGDNTYTGGTAISANGTLILGNDNALGTDALTIAASSTIQSDDDARVIDNDINVTSGNLTIGGSNDLMLNGDITGTLTGVVIDTTGTLTLAGNNTINGDMLVNSDATIVAGSDNALGTSTFGISANATLESDNDARTISTLINVNNGFTLTMGGSNDLTIGAIVGDGGLGKTGTGALTLTGNNTYTGGTTLSAGTVVLGNDNAFSTGDVTVNNIDLQSNDDARAISNNFSVGNGGTLFYSGSNNLTLDGVVSGSTGRIVATGTGTLALNGSNTHGGNTLLLNGGSIELGDSDALGTGRLDVAGTGTATLSTSLSSITISNEIGLDGGSLAIDATNDITVDGVISNTGSLTKTGSGTLTLNANNTFSGGTTLSGGTTILGNDNAFGTGNVSVVADSSVESDDDARVIGNDISIADNRIFEVAGSNDLILNGVISGNAATLDITNTGTTTLNGSNTHDETTLFAGSTTVLGNDNALGTGPLIVGGNSTIQSNDDARSIGNNINLQSGGLTVSGSNDLALTGAISGGGSLTKTGGSTLTLSGNNTYTGGSTLSGAGTVIVGHDNAFGTGNITMSSTSFQSNNDSNAISNNIAINNFQTLTFSGSNDLAIDGVISGGAGSIDAGGTGRLILNGSNTFGGGVELVNGGHVVIGNNNALGIGTVLTSGTGGTLSAGQSSITIANGLSTGTSSRSITIAGSNDLTVNGAITGSGNLVKTGSGTFTINNAGYSGSMTLTDGTLVLGSNGALGGGTMTVNGDGAIQSNDDARSIGNAISIGSGNTLTVSGSNDLAINGVISSDGSLTKSGTGTLTLSGTNTFSGGTTLSGGTTILGNDNAIGTGNISVATNSGIQSDNDARTIDNSISIVGSQILSITGSNDIVLNGDITSVGGGLNISNTGVTTLNGSNSSSGDTEISAGTIVLGNDDALGTGSALIVSGNSTLQSNDDARSIGIAIDIGNGNTLTASGSNDLALTGAISGGGSLTKTGGSTLTLSGNNTYTGGSTLSGAGTVIVGHDNAFGTGNITMSSTSFQSNNDSNAISNNIAINNFQTLTFSGSNDLAIDGVISGGAGSIDAGGTGRLILNGSNTFGGGVELVNGGHVVIGNNNALGIGTVLTSGTGGTLSAGQSSITIANGLSTGTSSRSITIAGSNDLTVNGAITGSGNLVKTGSGTFTINNAGYSGSMTLTDGTLVLGSNGALGGGTMTVNGDGAIQSNDDARSIGNAISIGSGNTLTVSGSNDLAINGVISSDGSLTKSGTGTLTLSGTNTFSGGTNISAGTLIASGGNALSDSGSVTFADISGATLQLGSNETIGSLSGGGSTGGEVSLQSNTLTVGDTNDTTFAGVLSGSGGLTKEGSGTLTLSNSNNTYTGDTTVNAGTLIINGTMASANVNVASGATLGGVMNFAGNFINSGTMSPGNSPGTMFVGGDLTLNSTSIYDMEIASTAGPGTGNDFIDVTGTAAIDGTLNVIGLGGYSPVNGDTFTILDADGGVSGTFATILDNFGSFNIEATYNANDIIIELIEVPFTDVVTARNLFSAAEAFARIAGDSPTGDMATVITQLQSLTDAELVVAFEQIVPNYLVPQAEATFKGIDVQNNNFNGRLNELRNGLPKLWSNNLNINTPDNASINDSADPEFAMMLAMQAQETLEQQQETARFTGAEKDIWGAWVNGFGTFGDYDSTSSQAGYNFNTGGVTFGFDYRVLDTLAAGAFVGYSNTGVTVDNGQGTNSFNSINTGMYMTWFNEQGFYASGLFGGGVNFYENNRRIRFGTVDRVAESDPTGFYLQTLATGGYEFKKGNWGFGPQLALQWVNLQIGSHSETGADSLNLDVGAFNGNSFVSRLGFRATYEYDTPAMLFVPELVGFWEHEYLNPINAVDVGVPAGGESFSYTGIGPGRDSGLIGVNLVGISHEAPVSFTLQYNVEFTPDDFIVNNVYAGVRISF